MNSSETSFETPQRFEHPAASVLVPGKGRGVSLVEQSLHAGACEALSSADILHEFKTDSYSLDAPSQQRLHRWSVATRPLAQAATVHATLCCASVFTQQLVIRYGTKRAMANFGFGRI